MVAKIFRHEQNIYRLLLLLLLHGVGHFPLVTDVCMYGGVRRDSLGQFRTTFQQFGFLCVVVRCGERAKREGSTEVAVE